MVPREQIPGFEPLLTDAPAPVSTGGVKGKRKSKKDKLREAAGTAATQPVAAPAPADAPVEPAEYFPFTPRAPQPRNHGRD